MEKVVLGILRFWKRLALYEALEMWLGILMYLYISMKIF
jgi:hypothetical protein